MKKKSKSSGFTLLEILLVVGIIAILAGIVILAINPTKQLGDTRNAQRRSDVLTILNAIYQYAIDNNGNLTDIANGGALAEGTAEDCDGVDDTDALGLDIKLLDNFLYLTSIPYDPKAVDGAAAAEYYLVQDANSKRITVCAPHSMGEGSIPENATDQMIKATR